jgi:hypothetical protein
MIKAEKVPFCWRSSLRARRKTITVGLCVALQIGGMVVENQMAKHK